MQIELAISEDENTPDQIFVFDEDGNGKLTGKKFPIEEDVEILETIMNATTSKIMEIIRKQKK